MRAALWARLSRLVVRLYPPGLRERYGDEIEGLLTVFVLAWRPFARGGDVPLVDQLKTTSPGGSPPVRVGFTARMLFARPRTLRLADGGV
jgi:hypothetical protein